MISVPSAGICQPARFERFALGGVVQQRRVRVVDMQKHLPARCRGRQGSRSRHHRPTSRYVPCACPVLWPSPAAIIRRRARPCRRRTPAARRRSRALRSSVHLGAGGDEVEILAACLVRDAQAQRIAGAVAARRMRLAFEIPGALAGHRERQHLDAGAARRRAGRLERPRRSRSAGAARSSRSAH